MGTLTSYSFLIVALGTVILAITSGAVGCINVLKGQSLIGDTIGHAAFPGVVLSFMLFLQRDPKVLVLGAIISGGVAYILIQAIHKYSKMNLDAILAIILSSFFGLGMVLKSYIQSNPSYSGASQSGLQNYIFGQAAYIMKADVKLIFAISIPIIILLILFYKEIKLYIFDEEFANTIGLNSKIVSAIILIVTISLIGAGLKVVGTVLISSFLIIPSIAAMQWSKKFGVVMVISSTIGAISAFVGTYISTMYSSMSTGPTIIIIMSIITFVSLIFGTNGVAANVKTRRKLK